MGAHGRIWNWLTDEIATKRERHKTLKMTTAQVVETTVTVNNSSIQDLVHPDDYAQLTDETTQIKDGLILRQRAKTTVLQQ